MARRASLRELFLGPHPRRRSARVRLTALYCSLFFPAGVALVLITYLLIVLVERPKPLDLTEHKHLFRSVDRSSVGGLAAHRTTTALSNATVNIGIVGHTLILDAREFVVGACIVLVAMIVPSALLGWFAAGRVLRPLEAMTTSTRRISERNLHERLALDGPRDELKDLGDTIDGLLARLEAAFESERRFVANASHELRTPLMLSQTILQVALADPAITLASLRAACEEAVDAGKDQAELIEALLTLARSQRGLEHREAVELTAVARDALRAHEAAAQAGGVVVEASLDDATTYGDARLLHRLVSNLVDNAIRYNLNGGGVTVELTAGAEQVTLKVTNSGPEVSPDEIGRLLQPFQHAASDRAVDPSGLGLGLSIVAQIAEAHEATLEVLARSGGGLMVSVSFAAAPIGGLEAGPEAPTS